MRWTIVLIIIALIFFIVWYGRIIYDKINFNATNAFRGIDLSSFNLSQLLTGGQTSVNANVTLNIKNDNGFSIPFKDLKVTFLYTNVMVAETSDYLMSQHFTIPSKDTIPLNGTVHGVLPVSDSITIYLNGAGYVMLKEKVAKRPVKIKYDVSLKIGVLNIFWIPISYTDSFDW